MTKSRLYAILRTLLRLGFIVLVAILIQKMMIWTTQHSKAEGVSGPSFMLNGMLFLVLLAYIILIAIPFVPGIEIGLALIMMQGTQIVPLIYVTTVSGLCLAFLVGRYLPYSRLQKWLADLGMRSAERMIAEIAPLSLAERTNLLRSRLPKFLATLLVDWRYLVLAVLINIPGNSVAGGGGGICMLAGVSRLFETRWVLITLILAVAPIPAVVLFTDIKLI